jgi:hypothetical protein
MTFTHKSIRIDVRENGYFRALVADAELTSDSLAGIKVKIDAEIAVTGKRALALPVVGVLTRLGRNVEDRKSVGRATLVGVNRTSRDLQFEGVPKECELDYALPDTPLNAATVRRWLDIDKEHSDLTLFFNEHRINPSGYGRIDMAKYEEILREVETNYAKATDRKPAKAASE